MNWRLFKDEQICPLFRTYLSFLLDAYNRDAGRMRNFLSYQRRWQEEVGSEDSHGRSIWALGYTIAYPPDDSLLGLITRLFKQLLLPVDSFVSPRAWAFTIIGALYYLKRFGGDPEVRKLLVNLSGQLCQQFSEYATEEWFWLEEIVTYDNARIPQALIGAGSYLQEQQILQTGLCALNWLISIQTNPAGGQLSLVGNNGWYRRGGEKAPFDQQPLDAAAMVAACTQAYLATGEPCRSPWTGPSTGFSGTTILIRPSTISAVAAVTLPHARWINMNQGRIDLSCTGLHEMHLTSPRVAGSAVAGTFSPSPRALKSVTTLFHKMIISLQGVNCRCMLCLAGGSRTRLWRSAGSIYKAISYLRPQPEAFQETAARLLPQTPPEIIVVTHRAGE